MDENRSVIKFLLSEVERACYIFQKFEIFFSKACISRSTIIAVIHSLERAEHA